MTLNKRLKMLRQEIGLSQEAIGAQGFVSTPGWIKAENGQRQASEKLIDRLLHWLVQDKYLRTEAANVFRQELLVLKYSGSRFPFLRGMAKSYARRFTDDAKMLAAEEPGEYHVDQRRRSPSKRTK